MPHYGLVGDVRVLVGMDIHEGIPNLSKLQYKNPNGSGSFNWVDIVWGLSQKQINQPNKIKTIIIKNKTKHIYKKTTNTLFT